MDDSGSYWIGPLAFGSSSTLYNSQCTVNGSAVSGSGLKLNVSFLITFHEAFVGSKNLYLMAEDDFSGLNSGLRLSGTWTVTNNDSRLQTSLSLPAFKDCPAISNRGELQRARAPPTRGPPSVHTLARSFWGQQE